MKPEHMEIRQQVIGKILSTQDGAFRWGFDERKTRQRPEFAYYSPNFKSTLWALVTLADLNAPAGNPSILAALHLIADHFYNQQYGVFCLPGLAYFPIPCLNGNMIYLHQQLGASPMPAVETTLAFFAAHQRFDDGGFHTPQSHPYCGNTSCYGKHTCYWGVVKLLKGISFIPPARRSPDVQGLLGNCIEFVLHHEVCFRSHNRQKFIHPQISTLTFPNFYKSDFLEILWLLAREGVRDPRLNRALDLLRSKQTTGRTWELEKSQNLVAPVGAAGSPNPFITERAAEVLGFYEVNK